MFRTTNNDAWLLRRNSLHSQPQPLSVQGFGHRFNPARRYSTIETRSRAAMVAGRLLGVPVEDSRSSVMAQRKFSSPACVDAMIYNHSTRMRSRPASSASSHSTSHVPNYLVRLVFLFIFLMKIHGEPGLGCILFPFFFHPYCTFNLR